MTQEEALKALNLAGGCSAAEIRQAYLDMVKVWHPDRFHDDPRLRAKADRALRSINEAYRFLQERAREDTARDVSEGAVRRGPASTATASTPLRKPPANANGWSRTTIATAALIGVTACALAGLAVWWPREPDVASPDASAGNLTDIALPDEGNGGAREIAHSRPLSGAEMTTPRRTGRGSLIVQNNEHRDAIIVLTEENVITRAIYLRAGERMTAVNIAPGVYRLRVLLGDRWADNSFRRNATYEELERQVEFQENARFTSADYTRVTIHLQPAATGHTGRRDVPPFLLPD